MADSKMSLRQVIARAMHHPEDVALKIRYRDRSEVLTDRFISPTSYRGQKKALLIALCLGREEFRQFEVDRIVNWREVRAADLLMPAPIEVVNRNETTDA